MLLVHLKISTKFYFYLILSIILHFFTIFFFKFSLNISQCLKEGFHCILSWEFLPSLNDCFMFSNLYALFNLSTCSIILPFKSFCLFNFSICPNFLPVQPLCLLPVKSFCLLNLSACSIFLLVLSFCMFGILACSIFMLPGQSFYLLNLSSC